MFRINQQIGNYTLIKPLGRGGFGEVWLAERHAKFVTTKVAVKLPHREKINAEAIKQEAGLWELASGHPNVLPIIEADEYDGQIVIVSEYAPDGTLDDLLRKEGILPAKRAIELSAGILRGLEFLHSRKIIHRDIKPANILLQEDTPRLTDFGMSRILAETSMSVEVYGTPYYMAPEAFSRKRNIQTDIWSFGVVLYKMLSGKLPFSGNDVGEIYAAVYNDKPQPLPKQVPLQLQSVVMKALAKDPERRYANAAAMREDLLDCLGELSAEKLKLPDSGNPGQAIPEPVTQLTQAAVSGTSENINFRTTNDTSQAAGSTLRYSTKAKRRFFSFKLLLPLAFIITIILGGGFFFFYNPQPIPFRKGDKFGFSSWGRRLIIGAKYDRVRPFSPNLALVAVGQKDTNGKFAGKYGFIDKRGREIIPLEYDCAESFSGNLAKVGKIDADTGQYKFGFIDESGKTQISLNYQDALSFSEDLAAVKFQNKWGLIDKTGVPVVPFKYDSIESFSDGLAAVKSAGKYGFIDKSGNEILPLVYERAEKFVDAIAPVMKDGKTFFIDSKGNEAIRFRYNHANSFSEGLAMVTLNGKSGFIEKSGGEAIALQYENEESAFSEGLAAVELNGKTGFIDRAGKTIVPFVYDAAEPINNHLALVKKDNDKEFYIGFDGTEFYEP